MLYFNSLKFIFVEYNNKLSFDKLGITDCINYSGKAIETVLFENHTYKYPCDVLLNGVEIGEKLLCNPLTIDKKIMNIYDSKNIIRVSQGYTKCNACVITNNALITEDEGIFIACRNNSIDCLKLESHSVKLDGYDYGFIGGASGKISKEIIAFCGDIDKHPEFDKIYSFCKNHGVNPISLSSDPLYDYGSIIAVGL
ncbi:hypothetical protein SDC9_119120 [bioreactor metagenome]|uniref:DUF6873 domain-containing protein n=1 Tax=bioreactor metagenome TaxID=1076179 RepID=A0A645C4L8_9ZZZZ|nr:hypothetical protein [Oscillospiraceae bacterium]